MTSSSFDFKVYRVGITKSAKQDLSIIYELIKETSGTDHYADKQLKVIESEICKLSIFPNGHPLYQEKLKYRICHIGKYRVIFRVFEGKSEVDIIRIFHARQNVDGLLGD